MRLCRGVGKRLRERLLCWRCGGVLCRAVPCRARSSPRIYLSLPPRRAHDEATLRGNYLRQRYGRDYRRGEREQLLGVSGAAPGPPSPSVARAGVRPELGQGEGETRTPPWDGIGEAAPQGQRCCVPLQVSWQLARSPPEISPALVLPKPRNCAQRSSSSCEPPGCGSLAPLNLPFAIRPFPKSLLIRPSNPREPAPVGNEPWKVSRDPQQLNFGRAAVRAEGEQWCLPREGRAGRAAGTPRGFGAAPANLEVHAPEPHLILISG